MKNDLTQQSGRLFIGMVLLLIVNLLSFIGMLMIHRDSFMIYNASKNAIKSSYLPRRNSSYGRSCVMR